MLLQVQALRSLEFYVCYYGWGDYKKRETNCKENDVFNAFSFIIAAVPFTWRLLQVHKYNLVTVQTFNLRS